MNMLTFDQKAILSLYNCFYGNIYPAPINVSDNVTQVHVNAQKMCYLLKVVGVEVGDFNYSWNFHGPFSPGLLALLRSIDTQRDNVCAYYNNADTELSMFSESDKEKINTLIEELKLSEHADDSGNWMELLGSLVFISHSILPGEGYTTIINELKSRKPKFANDKDNITAWNTLKEAGLLKGFA